MTTTRRRREPPTSPPDPPREEDEHDRWDGAPWDEDPDPLGRRADAAADAYERHLFREPRSP